MDLRKLASEVDVKNTIEAFEVLRQDTDLFYSWNKFDIQKLCENVKVLSFSRNGTIIHKNETVEYFGIILSGKLLIKQGDKVTGHLGPGDIVGYMSYMEFTGTKISPFDITAEVEGYLATFRYDEFKQLNKKDPQLAYKITEMLAKKALNTVSLQYKGEEIYKPARLKPSAPATNTKKVKDAMETCPELTEFFDRLDQRDKKNLTKTFEYIEFEREQKLAYEGLAANYLLIVIKGELISFREDKPAIFYKPGTIVGVREFLYGLSWTENILGKAKGTLLKLQKESFEELKQSSASSASGFIKALVWHQCKDIKNRYQDRAPIERSKEQASLNPLNEFVEYEITKHAEFINGQQTKLNTTTTPLIKDFMTKKEMLPLYMHNIHKSLLENQKPQGAGESSRHKESNLAGCAFLREKMEKQLEEARLNKIRNKGKLQPKKTVVDGKKTDEKGATDEDYEDLKNAQMLLETENQELRDELKQAYEENKVMTQRFKELQQLQMTSSTRINKTMVHKELLSKDFINNDTATFLTRNYNSQFASFGDVLKDQHFVSSKAKRVAKFAYKWLAATKARKRTMVM